MKVSNDLHLGVAVVMAATGLDPSSALKRLHETMEVKP